MIHFYKHLVHPEENVLYVCRELVKVLNVPITRHTLKNDLETHPDYPSLLSMSDVLTDHGVANMSVRLSPDQLNEVETPFVALVRDKKGNKLYDLVIGSDGQYVDSIVLGTIDWDNFKKQYEGVILLTEVSSNAGEKNYGQKHKQEKIQKFALDSTLLFVPAVIVIFAFYHPFTKAYTDFFPICYMLLSLVGWAVGTLLLWYEIDSGNAALKEVCGGGNVQQGSCDAVLKSGGASIFGVSWSEVGFSFFTAILFGQLIIGVSLPTTLAVLFSVSMLASLYVPFSLIYQGRIARQWCPLCLTVQGVLTLQVITSLLGGWQHYLLAVDMSIGTMLPIFLIGTVTLLVVHQLVPIIKENRRLIESNRRLTKFKYDLSTFEMKLKQQKSIELNTMEHLGITIGNPQAKHSIVKVCNPYCGPCAKAHPLIDELVDNNPDVKVHILFTASNDSEDKKAPPVRHLLAVASKGDRDLTKEALDTWYNAEVKDYKVFAARYPINGEMALQGDKIEAMRNWCDHVDIQFTPTFFVNGYQLPEHYRLEDLRYLLRS